MKTFNRGIALLGFFGWCLLPLLAGTPHLIVTLVTGFAVGALARTAWTAV